jgi:cytoskeletal protein RodZ
VQRNQQGAARVGLIVIIVIAALIALGALTFMVVSSMAQPDETPDASASDSATPSESATPEAPSPEATPTATSDPQASAAILSLTPADGSSSGCTDTIGSVDVTFTWTTSGAAHVYFGVRTDNAKASPFASDLAANSSIVAEYPCGFGSELYTLTIEDSAGALVHKSVTLLN